MPPSFALVIPTLNAGGLARQLAARVRLQTVTPMQWVVVDSSSNDDTCAIFREAGARVDVIARRTFNHGRTRQMAFDSLSKAVDVVMFMTQDALPVDAWAFERLLSAFDNDKTGAAYGRQVAFPHTGSIGAHARLFNYPASSRLNTIADQPRLGIKTVFISNSFAAYRRQALSQAGGFPPTIHAEDMAAGARMVLSGWAIAYVADAVVMHSHDYTMSQEFKRYFDIGVFHAREKWIVDAFGNPGGEGKQYVMSELRYLSAKAPLLIVASLVRNALKFLGYQLGRREARLPRGLKRKLSMNRPYWGQSEG